MGTPTLHYVCGPVGAGKTTYAIALADRVKGIRLATDEWIEALFGADAPRPWPRAWTVERAARCEAQMWALAEQLIARDTNVVFDVPLARQEDRDRFRPRASMTRAMISMHYFDVDREIRQGARPRAERRERACAPSAVTEADFFDVDAITSSRRRSTTSSMAR